MISAMVWRDEKLIAKLLVSGAAYLVLLSIGLNNSIYTNAKEIAMNINNTHTSSASTQAELFPIDRGKEKEIWRIDVDILQCICQIFSCHNLNKTGHSTHDLTYNIGNSLKNIKFAVDFLVIAK